jgi:hypothetical protein
MSEFWKKHWDDIPILDVDGLRRFGLVTAGIIGGLFGLALPWFLGKPFPVWPWAIAVPLSALALLAPASLKIAYHGWMVVAVLLAWINTRVIIGLVFFLVVLPMGLMLRVLRRDLLALKFDATLTSYRVPRGDVVTSMKKPF